MSIRGKKPTPINVRINENPTGRAVRDRSMRARRNRGDGGVIIVAEPASPDSVPTPPMSLKDKGRGQEYWAVYWTHAAAWLTQADMPMVTRLCELWDLYDDLRQGIMLQTDGHYYYESRQRGRTGKNVGHPMLASVKDVVALMERLEGDLGLSPVERSRIRLERGEKGSPLDEWQRSRQARKTATS